MKLGDISSLGAKLYPSKGTKHKFFNLAPDICLFYGRDRNDPVEDVSSRKYNNLTDCYENELQDHNYLYDVENES